MNSFNRWHLNFQKQEQILIKEQTGTFILIVTTRVLALVIFHEVKNWEQVTSTVIAVQDSDMSTKNW